MRLNEVNVEDKFFDTLKGHYTVDNLIDSLIELRASPSMPIVTKVAQDISLLDLKYKMNNIKDAIGNVKSEINIYNGDELIVTIEFKVVGYKEIKVSYINIVNGLQQKPCVIIVTRGLRNFSVVKKK